MKDKSTILLLGYRATGKTTCGKILAKRLGWRFFDMDKALKERFGKNIDEVVEVMGWGAFRAEEKRLLHEILTSPHYEMCVVSTGGGVVLHQELLEKIPPHIITVWLKASPTTIAKRMSLDGNTAKDRPPLTQLSDPISEIQEVLNEREPLYRRFSHMTIDVDGLTPHEISERIARHAW